MQKDVSSFFFWKCNRFAHVKKDEEKHVQHIPVLNHAGKTDKERETSHWASRPGGHRV